MTSCLLMVANLLTKVANWWRQVANRWRHNYVLWRHTMTHMLWLICMTHMYDVYAWRVHYDSCYDSYLWLIMTHMEHSRLPELMYIRNLLPTLFIINQLITYTISSIFDWFTPQPSISFQLPFRRSTIIHFILITLQQVMSPEWHVTNWLFFNGFNHA